MSRQTYALSSEIPASAAALYRWHLSPGAFERLAPPWQAVRLVGQPGPPEEGSRLEFRLVNGPLAPRWVAEHRNATPSGQRVASGASRTNGVSSRKLSRPRAWIF